MRRPRGSGREDRFAAAWSSPRPAAPPARETGPRSVATARARGPSPCFRVRRPRLGVTSGCVGTGRPGMWAVSAVPLPSAVLGELSSVSGPRDRGEPVASRSLLPALRERGRALAALCTPNRIRAFAHNELLKPRPRVRQHDVLRGERLPRPSAGEGRRGAHGPAVRTPAWPQPASYPVRGEGQPAAGR